MIFMISSFSIIYFFLYDVRINEILSRNLDYNSRKKIFKFTMIIDDIRIYSIKKCYI